MGRGIVSGVVCASLLILLACGETEENDASEGPGGAAGAGGAGGSVAGQGPSAGAPDVGGSSGGRPAGGRGGAVGNSGGRAGSRNVPEPSGGGAGGAEAAAAGAGGEPALPAACSLEPCGGDPVGKWEVTRVCVQPTVELPGMPGCDPTLEDLEVQVTGSAEMRADGTYAFDQTLSYAFHVFYRTACVGEDVDSPELACVLISQVVEAQGGTATCEPDSTGCGCQVGLTVESAASGEYALDGDRLTLDSGSAFSFCVRDDQLMLRELENDATLAYRLVP